jgi:hypothetical protein
LLGLLLVLLVHLWLLVLLRLLLRRLMHAGGHARSDHLCRRLLLRCSQPPPLLP